MSHNALKITQKSERHRSLFSLVVGRLLALRSVLYFSILTGEPLQVIAPVPTKIYAFLKIWCPCLPEPGIELMTENTQIWRQRLYQLHHRGIGSFSIILI